MISFTLKGSNALINYVFNKDTDFLEWMKETDLVSSTPVTQLIVNSRKITPKEQISRIGTDEFWIEDILSYLRDLTMYQWKISEVTEDFLHEGLYLANLSLATDGVGLEDIFPNIHDMTGSLVLKFRINDSKPDVETIDYPEMKGHDELRKSSYRLNPKEKALFEEMLRHFLNEELETNSDGDGEGAADMHVDVDMFNFGCMTVHNIPSLPLTIALFSEGRCKSIVKTARAAGLKDFQFFPRVILSQETLGLAFDLFGEQGSVNQCLETMDDVARIPYIITNCDTINVSEDGKVIFTTEYAGKQFCITVHEDLNTLKSVVEKIWVEKA